MNKISRPFSKLLNTVLAGLSSSPTGYGWLNHFHNPVILAHPSQLKISGVLGSSLQTAQAAIKKHGLSDGVAAYGHPSEPVEDDRDPVEFLVVGVKVGLHRDVLMPLLRSGRLKAIFVEWPVDRTAAETEEIARIARAQNLRTAVGLQGRYSALTRRLAQLVKTGEIGRILSTSVVVGTVPTGDGETEKFVTKYALTPDSGATMLDVHFAHFIECLTFALHGDIASVNGLVKTMHPITNIVDDKTGEIIERDYPKPSPDHVLVQGTVRPQHRESVEDPVIPGAYTCAAASV